MPAHNECNLPSQTHTNTAFYYIMLIASCLIASCLIDQVDTSLRQLIGANTELVSVSGDT